MILRPYQEEAVNSVYEYLRNNPGNPCVVLPTASGKTPVLATICKDAVTKWNGRVLVLSHVKELLQQAADKLQAICPEVEVGVYSAGLKSRDTDASVIVAGIQSVHKRACELDRFDLIIVDECHLLPPDGEGMYQGFFKETKIVNPRVRLIGLTATPYRLKSGTLVGPDNLLNAICYEIGVKELIEQRYLCPLKSKSGRKKVDCTQLHIRGGEFIASELDELMNTDDNVEAACREIVSMTRDRNSVLIFAVSVAHAERIQKTLEKLTNGECGIVTGGTPTRQREILLLRFKGETFRSDLFGERTGPLKYLVNVNVLTTGFDAPNVDCVVLLRPTNSPGLYVQILGRGFRLHPSKTDCLVLDYGGNILRHGPVDAVRGKDRKKSGSGEAPAKECPQCLSLLHTSACACPDCGYEFPPPERRDKHDAQAASEGVLSGEVIDEEFVVDYVHYSVHKKRGADEDAPKTMRVDYEIGINNIKSEWVCPEHSGWARRGFEKWWSTRSQNEIPETAAEAVRVAQAGGLSAPLEIVVRKVAGQRFDSIIRYKLPAERPAPVEIQAEQADMSLCNKCLNYHLDDDFSYSCCLDTSPENSENCVHFAEITEDDIPF